MPTLSVLILSLTFVGLAGCSGQSGPPVIAVDATVIDDTVALPSDFPLAVGRYWPAGSEFAALEEGQEMEIVQGIQGGVHTEVALELDLGFAYADTTIVHFDLHIQTVLDGQDVVADLRLDGFKAGNVGLGRFHSQTLPVIFEQNEAVHYQGKDAVIVAQVTFEDSVSARAIPIHLVDTRNDLDDL